MSKLQKKHKYGILGTAVAGLAMLAHITHAPIWILGLFSFGATAMVDSVWVKLAMGTVTAISLFALWRHFKGHKRGDCHAMHQECKEECKQEDTNN